MEVTRFWWILLKKVFTKMEVRARSAIWSSPTKLNILTRNELNFLTWNRCELTFTYVS